MVLYRAEPWTEPLLLVMQISRGFCELKAMVFALNFHPSIFPVPVSITTHLSQLTYHNLIKKGVLKIDKY